jgi:hypothetical protein
LLPAEESGIYADVSLLCANKLVLLLATDDEAVTAAVGRIGMRLLNGILPPCTGDVGGDDGAEERDSILVDCKFSVEALLCSEEGVTVHIDGIDCSHVGE